MKRQADFFNIDPEVELEDYGGDNDQKKIPSDPIRETESRMEKRILDRYCREISKTPLLGKGGDIALKREIISVEYLARFPVSHKEAEEIFQKLENLKSRFIKANLRLVITIARSYLDRGLNFLDLIQEGNIGLMRAVDKFDPERNIKFNTHAYWWIRQAILRAIVLKGRTIYITGDALAQVNKYDKTRDFLLLMLRREPSDEEVAKKMGVKIELMKKIKRTIACKQMSSLDNVANENKSKSLFVDFIPSKGESPEVRAMRNDNLNNLKNKLHSLTSQEKKVITLRLGINGRPHTLKEVGNILGGLTRERARQLEVKALEKLKISNVKRYVMSNR